MVFEQYYLECLSHASYLVGDTTTGRAAVIDPQRDVSGYLADAAEAGLTITHVIETHFHADFLSGHLELAAATGATIVYGRAADGRVEFPIQALGDGDHIDLGEVDLEILETPGHTPESISVVVREHGPDSTPYGVLTGDTLFIGDVGRPDLLAAIGFTADELAHQLYDSLHEKLLTLPDATKVFPAHGAGSACGKSLSTETVSTIGEQRRTNYALQPMSAQAFVEAVTDGQSVAPLYFLFAATKNRQERELHDEAATVTMLGLDEVLAARADGAVVIDTRDNQVYAQGHLKGAVNVGLNGRFAEYAGEVMEPDTPVVIVCEPGTEAEARTRLARIGFDNLVGALDDPIQAMATHPEHVERMSRLAVAQLKQRMAEVPGLVLVDIRNPGETALGTIPGAVEMGLPAMLRRQDELDKDAPIVVYCAGGYRSAIASSLLRSHGFTDVSDLVGGYTAWTGTEPVEGIPAITVEEANADPSLLVVDVREPFEWDEVHAPQAVHVPLGDLPAHLGELDASRRIACLCRSGNRSGTATAWLLQQGFDAVNVTGGMIAWLEQGLPVAHGETAGAVS
jgi:rhodanese-related sulfurtransferase/glyoxylase-like metal-dependent hydrolase (beta-lactamase superfamily II)